LDYLKYENVWHLTYKTNHWSGHYQVVITWTGDCLRTVKPSCYITNTEVNSAFHPSGVEKSSTGPLSWG